MSTAPELKKGLKQRHLTMIAIGGVIGAGLFVGSGVVLQTTGPGAFLTYAVTGVLIVMVMRMLGEMATANPSTGSFSDYSRAALGHWAGFSVAWLYWYFWVVVVGFEAVAGAKVLQFWLPGVPLWLMAFVLMVLMTVDQPVLGGLVRRVRVLVRRHQGRGHRRLPGARRPLRLGRDQRRRHALLEPHRARRVPAQRAWARSSPRSWWWCSRWSARRSPRSRRRSRTTRRRRSPGRPTPWCCASRTFYVGSVFLLACMIPWNSDELAASPYVTAFDIIGIPGAEHVMNAVVLTAVLSCLNSGLYTASRMLFVLAARREAPIALLTVNGKGVPVRAILFSSVIGFLCVIAAYVSPDTVFAVPAELLRRDHPVRLPADLRLAVRAAPAHARGPAAP